MLARVGARGSRLVRFGVGVGVGIGVGGSAGPVIRFRGVAGVISLLRTCRRCWVCLSPGTCPSLARGARQVKHIDIDRSHLENTDLVVRLLEGLVSGDQATARPDEGDAQGSTPVVDDLIIATDDVLAQLQIAGERGGLQRLIDLGDGGFLGIVLGSSFATRLPHREK